MFNGKRIGFCVKLTAILAVLTTVVLPLVYVAQERGICLKAGKVLNPNELRRQVLLNVINYEIENTAVSNKGYDSDNLWLGIASPAIKTNISELIKESFNNGKSFEENFGLKVLIAGRRHKNFVDSVNIKEIAEPFLLTAYGTYLGAFSVIYISSDIQEIYLTNIKSLHKLQKAHELTLYERLLGYGNHFFYIPNTMINRECCDNRMNYRSREEYLERKYSAYLSSLDYLDKMNKQTHIVFVSTGLAAASNCGDLLMTETDDPGFSHNIIKRVPWINGE